VGASGSITVDDVRRLASAVASALRANGRPAEASVLHDAVSAVVTDAESLLVLRSALVATRTSWEALPDVALVANAKGTLAAAKRLAIDL